MKVLYYLNSDARKFELSSELEAIYDTIMVNNAVKKMIILLDKCLFLMLQLESCEQTQKKFGRV